VSDPSLPSHHAPSSGGLGRFLRRFATYAGVCLVAAVCLGLTIAPGILLPTHQALVVYSAILVGVTIVGTSVAIKEYRRRNKA
jgi:hypothetical protein